jgi:hypothetical protein
VDLLLLFQEHKHMSSPLLFQEDPPPDTGISSSVKSVIFLFFFPDFAPPLGAGAAVAALFSRSRAFRLSAFAAPTRRAECLASLGEASISRFRSFCGKQWEAHDLDVLKANHQKTYAKIYRGPPGVATPAGQTGPRQCSGARTQGPRVGPRGNARCPRTQRLWGPRPS